MVAVLNSIREDYWESFTLQEEDTEFVYNYLLELETPLTSDELAEALIGDRIRREKLALEKQRTSGGQLYQPMGKFRKNQKLIFPAFGWQIGQIIDVRKGSNPNDGNFKVIKVAFEDGSEREFASGIADHILNEPPKISEENELLDSAFVIQYYGEKIKEQLISFLESSQDFVRIAFRWFPRELLVDINEGHLNLAEAVLDMADGGPLPTLTILEQIEVSARVNPKLLEFSLDHALQEDPRFDEVGPAGDILWFLKRLEPKDVIETPIYLRYHKIDIDRSLLTQEMLDLEKDLDDELSPLDDTFEFLNDGKVRLIFPHWASGTLPLSSQIRHLFPTAYEAPRIRFIIIDGETGNRFPGWVVREKKYVYGLGEWYSEKGLIPGSIVRVSKSEIPGEVIINTEHQHSSKEWIKTLLIGSDGGIVFATLKQKIRGSFDDRMAIAIPDIDSLTKIWEKYAMEPPAFEKILVNIIKELAKEAPQSHVHASEVYAAMNVIMRCPPAPILGIMASRPWFVHVGDLHFRLDTSEDISIE